MTRGRSGIRFFDDAEERTPRDRERGRENRVQAFQEMVRSATGSRRLTPEVVASWHRILFDRNSGRQSNP